MDYEVCSDFGTNGTVTDTDDSDMNNIDDDDDDDDDEALDVEDEDDDEDGEQDKKDLQKKQQSKVLLSKKRSHLNSHHVNAAGASTSSSAGAQIEFDDLEFKYEVLTPDRIVKAMIDCIKEVNQVVQLPATTTRILLHYFRWDKEKLMERFYDSDQDGLFKEAHVMNPFKTLNRQRSQQQQRDDDDDDDDLYCNICYTNKRDDMMTGLECGHKFCRACWKEYLTTKIIDEGMGQTISCASHNCDILVDDNTVMSLLDDQRVKLKYQQLITNSFVECNRLIRWCPSPNCSNAVKAQYYDAQPVTCTCGYTFCFACGELWHDPVKCRWLKKWIKKCDDDSETSNWIAANTKECPKCHVTIEKNGGCNHMICKNQACRMEFCWVCCGPWEPHGSSWYNCNRYNEDDAKKARDSQEKSRHALQRYLHYCNRYMNHFQSLKLEHKLYAAVREKMEEMQQHNMSWIEVQFLKKAVDVLRQCRQTLMYTYAFAFYLKKNNHSMIFEDNQADLEMATEKLSGYLERDITSDNVIDIKQKVQDKYRYCEQRRKVMLDHVHEGYEKDYWEYQEDL